MDFLDSIELDSTRRRSRQVRSWYLYEQYKSLERNQMEATRKLQDRSQQDRLLHQVLSEHRERRQMCNVQDDKIIIDFMSPGSSRHCITSSFNDLFDSFCEAEDDQFGSDDFSNLNVQHHADDELLKTAEDDTDLKTHTELEDNCCLPLILDEKAGVEIDSKIANDTKQHLVAYNELENIRSLPLIFEDKTLLQISASKGNLADDLKEELEYVKRNIVENIHLQLEMKQNVQSLQGFAKLRDYTYESKAPSKFDDKASSRYEEDIDESDENDDGESLCSTRQCAVLDTNEPNYINMLALWTKFVSFAYQVVQLNHGNCHYDYSSQFLTAVLACDVLRRGISRMWNVLQPYVSPIKFSSDRNLDPRFHRKKEKSTKSSQSQITKNTRNYMYKKKYKRGRVVHKLCIKSPTASTSGEKINTSVKRRRPSLEHKTRMPLLSEAWPSCTAYPSLSQPSEKRSSTIWPEELHTQVSMFSSCCTRVTNPMLELASYIDSIIDIDDS